jgi:hypothetical protein
MLFVDDHEAEIPVDHVPGKKGMGSQDYVDFSGSQRLKELCPPGGFKVSCKIGGPYAQRLQKPGGVFRMLPGKEFRGRHDGALPGPSFNGPERGEECCQRFAGPHIALEEPGHGVGAGHVGVDFRNSFFLTLGQGEGQPFQKLLL